MTVLDPYNRPRQFPSFSFFVHKTSPFVL